MGLPQWWNGTAIALAAGLIAGGVPFLVSPPEGLAPGAWHVLGIGVMMAIWWMAEIVPLAATALIPLALFPLIGIAPISDVAPAYAHPLIILFLGGFLIAGALQSWGLHMRLAHGLLRFAGDRPVNIVAAMMGATAFLSLWISNTATTMIMAPIGIALATARSDEDDTFAAALLIAIAYAATIGGMGSLIGTPPNALFAAYMQETHGLTIGFAKWAAFGLPVVAILLPVTWLLLTRFFYSVQKLPVSRWETTAEPMSTGARRVAAIAAATALAWVLRPLLERVFGDTGLTDSGIAMIAALALFLCPDGAGGRLLTWKAAQALRWDVLILFGGGLALARAIDTTGLAPWLATVAASLDWLPAIALVGAFAAVIVLVGELASNTAMAAIFLPVVGATAAAMGADPLQFTLPVALAASIGFMLPVATPPNAIVFAYPAVTRERLLVAGAPLDLIGGAVAVGVGYLLAPLVFAPS